MLQTISYADIFGYPLKKEEIKKWLIGAKEGDEEEIVELLRLNKIKQKDGYFFLKRREKTVKQRKKREEWSENKLEIAQETAKKLQIIPFIKMIAATGALTMDNCTKDDDIDLMIVTEKNSLWVTRLLIIFLCPFLSIQRRKPKEKEVKDKICFNLFLDEKDLEIKEKNLFTAHEICQVKPLLNKNKAYERFLSANEWAREYLPNAFHGSWFIVHGSKSLLRNNPLSFLLALLNWVAFKFQHLYMKPKITLEKVSLSQVFFHPKKPSKKVEEFAKIKLP